MNYSINMGKGFGKLAHIYKLEAMLGTSIVRNLKVEKKLNNKFL